MFRRRWSGLPKDVTFPSDLKGLGYFINEDDEIRSIEHPDNYFKFFINKNPRINQRQRFHFDNALEDIIHQRLKAQGLEKVALPLGTPTSKPHVPVFTSRDLRDKSRIVLIIGEPTKALGMLAGRVANGPGGIAKGSMVSVVQEVQKQTCSATDPSPPGIVIANPGQLYWWPEGQRSLTVTDSTAIPLPSLVHAGQRHVPGVNTVQGHETPEKHVDSILGTLLETMADGAKVSVVAVGQSCELVTSFLNSEEHWQVWKSHLDAMLLLGTAYPADDITNAGVRDFLAKRTRAYITSPEPLDAPLAPPCGNQDGQIPALGCPCYSSSEAFYGEMVLIAALEPALEYLQSVAMTPGFENDEILVLEKPGRESTEDDWDKLSDSEKPPVGVVDADIMKMQMKVEKRWKKFRETGEAYDTDSSDDDV